VVVSQPPFKNTTESVRSQVGCARLRTVTRNKKGEETFGFSPLYFLLL
jgi:hypothetical protein